MSIHGMSAGSETLLFLAWATRTGLQKRLLQIHTAHPQDLDAAERTLRAELTFSQPPVFEGDRMYGPVYKALFDHRLDQVNFQLVDWALRGFNAVYLHQEDPQAMEIAVESEGEEEGYTTPETGVLCEAIDDRLLCRLEHLGDECQGDVRQLAKMLKLHFTLHTPLVLRTPECSFLFQEFIIMSLEQVNWDELAALVLDVAHDSQELPQDEESVGDDDVIQLALAKELLWRSYTEFGEMSQNLSLSESDRDLCLDVADQCFHAHGALGQKDNDSAE